MPAAVRPYVTAGVALVGASVISVIPIAPSQPDIRPDVRVASPAVRLAAQSIANVPVNLVQAIASMPANGVAGLNRYANAMRASGSWWVYTPTNVLGWDPANPEMTKGLVDALLAIPSLSGPMGEAINWWLTANLPMHAGCTGLPPCPDPAGILGDMFRVPIWDFFGDGYTFPDLNNPISEEEGAVGHEIPGSEGPPVDWSGDTVVIDPFAGIKSFANFLLEDPQGVETVTVEEALDAIRNVIDAHVVTWNPFVPMSYIWNPEAQFLAPVFRLFAPVLCPTCNPVDPSLPPVTPPAESGQTLTLDAAVLRADLDNEVGSADAQQGGSATAGLVDKLGVTGGEVPKTDVAGNEVEARGAHQDGLPAADLANKSTAEEVLTTGQGDEAAAGASGVDTAIEATAPPNTTPAVPSNDLTRDGNKVEPGQFGPKHRKPGGGVSDAVKSVQDKINASISKITDGLKGGDTTKPGDTTKTGDAD